MEDLKAAIEALQRARETKLAELQAIERALEALGMPPLAGRRIGPQQNLRIWASLAPQSVTFRRLGLGRPERSPKPLRPEASERRQKTSSRPYMPLWIKLRVFKGRMGDGSW